MHNQVIFCAIQISYVAENQKQYTCKKQHTLAILPKPIYIWKSVHMYNKTQMSSRPSLCVTLYFGCLPLCYFCYVLVEM